MSNDAARIAELSLQGFCCSQVLALMGLALVGTNSPELVRAMMGLCGGIGSSGATCGALTGGVCVLHLFAGKGAPEEKVDFQLGLMTSELIEWFTAEYTASYGGILCREILAGNPMHQRTRCPQLVVATWEKVKEILLANGYPMARGR